MTEHGQPIAAMGDSSMDDRRLWFEFVDSMGIMISLVIREAPIRIIQSYYADSGAEGVWASSVF
jgi:hypothetical protein